MISEENIPEFGFKRENEERRDGGCAVVYDPKSERYAVGRQHKNGSLRLFSGSVERKEDIKSGILREVTEQSGLYEFLHVEKIGQAFTHYYNTLSKLNRCALSTCFLIILKNSDLEPVTHEAREKFSLEWKTSIEIFADFELYNEQKDNDHWIYFMKKAILRARELGFDTKSNLG